MPVKPTGSDSSDNTPWSALAGLRVLDLSQFVAGPFCARLLGDYGADVIKVERPVMGDISRRSGPFPPTGPDSERSGLFLHLNSNKRSIVLDFGSYQGRERLLELVRQADVLVESFRPGTLERWGLGPYTLQTANPRLVIMRISNFGQTGPYRDWKASEIVLYAIGGEMHSTGVAGREPIKHFGTVTQFEAGATAATATLGALLHAEATGHGQVIDCALIETQLAGIDRRASSLLAYAYSGMINRRIGGAGAVPTIWPCSDGYVDLVTGAGITGGGGQHWPRVLEMLGRPENLLSERFTNPNPADAAELRDEFVATVLEWSVGRSKREAWSLAQAARVLSGPLNTIADMYADPVLRERGVFSEVDHPAAGTVVQPGRPFIMDRTPAHPPRPAPLLGQHQEEVFAESQHAASRPAIPAGSPVKARASSSLPLAGVRVVDLTVVWAGPFATHILADLGAEVIRVENVNAWQTLTRGVLAHPSKALLDSLPPWMGGLPDGEPGERPWNRSPVFNAHARNKQSVTIDLHTEAGKRNFAQLVAASDIVVDNNVAETTRKLGITYETLLQMREDIIFLRQPAFADDGPYQAYRAFGIHLEGFIGHTLLRRYPDLDASMTSPVFVADFMAGALGAFAALAALRHRRRTGEGQRIELGQAENALAIVAQAAMEYALAGTEPEPLGNCHTTAIQGVYRCEDEPDDPGGPDRWLALTIESDREWAALGSVIVDPEWLAWAAEPRFSIAAGRRACHDEIDERLGAWIPTQRARELMNRLQTAGVAAGLVMHAADCFADPHLAARGFFRETSQVDCGTHLLPGFMWQFQGTPLEIRRGPVRFGEDNAAIYQELLGLTATAYDALVSAGEVGDEFAAGIP